MTTKITLNIEAGTPGELRTILAQLLGTITVANATDAPALVQGSTPVVEAKPEVPAAPAAAPAKAKSKAKDTPAVAAAPTPTPTPEEAPAVTPAPAKAKPAAPAPASAEKGPELPDEIRNTNSMRDLLTYLVEHGADSVDALVASCTVLKKDVPILSKVPNVEERVRRAADVLDLFPAAADAAPDAE